MRTVAMVSVGLDDVTVHRHDHAGSAVRALDDVSLDVRSGELMVLAGPSGSGKTTLLRVVAGLEPLSRGTVRIDDAVVDALSPGERDVALVSQLESLFPYMTVEDNLAFALRLRRTPTEETRHRVHAEARTLGLFSRLRRRPRQLSTGERQKVALGRATTRRPRVFLFDEPLAGLDSGERDRLRHELSRLQRGFGVTTIYVTHDQRDAMALADRIAVLDSGRLAQVDTPMDVYRRPANLFVARFFGTPPMGVVEGPLHDDGTTAWIDVAGVALRLLPAQRDAVVGRVPRGTRLALGVRASAVRLADAAPSPAPRRRLAMEVSSIEPLGSSTIVRLRPPGPDRTAGGLYTVVPPRRRLRRGQRPDVDVDLGEALLFDAATGTVLHRPADHRG